MTRSRFQTLDLIAVVLSLLGVILFAVPLFHLFHQPFPPLSETLAETTTELQDFVGVGLGFRRLAADISWIETLEYYGTTEANMSDSDEDNGRGNYPLFLSYCERTTRIDPYFIYAYNYGAGALGWNLNRIDEAQKLLKEGIAANPNDWRLQQYLAAMSYEKDHDSIKIASFLESFLYQPDCPNMLRSMLANIYKKKKQYRDAIRVWLVVADSRDPAYAEHAETQISAILALDPSLLSAINGANSH